VLKSLSIAIALLALSGCKDQICNCPFEPSGTGWCHKDTPNAYQCAAVCGISVPCPGYCLPDGGNTLSTPFRCDAGQ
jgi:hypothetical protein